MDLQIIKKITEQPTIHIGKTGTLRMNKKVAQMIGLEKNQTWAVAHDKDEHPASKHMYLLTHKDGSHIEGGFKFTFQNGSWFHDIKIATFELRLNVPMSLNFELFEFQNFRGIKIILH